MSDPLEEYKKRIQEILNEIWVAVEMPEEGRQNWRAKYLLKRGAEILQEKGEDAARTYVAEGERRRAQEITQYKLALSLVEGASTREFGESRTWGGSQEMKHVQKLIEAGGGLPLSKETEEKVQGYLGRKMAQLRDKEERTALANKLVNECFDRWGVGEADRGSYRFRGIEEKTREKLKKVNEPDVVKGLDEEVRGIKAAIDRDQVVDELIAAASGRGSVDLTSTRQYYQINAAAAKLVEEGGELPLSKETRKKVEKYLDHQAWRISSRDERQARAKEMTASAKERVGDNGQLRYGIEKDLRKLLGKRGVTEKDVEAFLDKEVGAAQSVYDREMRVEKAIEDARERWGIRNEHTKGYSGRVSDEWWQIRSGLQKIWEKAEASGIPLEDIRASAREYLDRKMEPVRDRDLVDRLTTEAIESLPDPNLRNSSFRPYDITSAGEKAMDAMREFFALVPGAREAYDKDAIIRAWVHEKVGAYAEVSPSIKLVDQVLDNYRLPPSLRPLYQDGLQKHADRVAQKVDRFFALVPGAKAVYNRSEIIAADLDGRVVEIARKLSVSPERPSVERIQERVWYHLRYRKMDLWNRKEVKAVLAPILLEFRIPTDSWGAAHPAMDERQRVFDKIVDDILPAIADIRFDLWRKEGGRYIKEEKKLRALCDELAEKIHSEVDWNLAVGKYMPQKRVTVNPAGQLEMQPQPSLGDWVR